MAWYFSPRDTAKCGVKRVRCLYKMPMQSTGKEKFTVYVYFKTELWKQENPWSESESDISSEDSSDEQLGFTKD